ncbi:MAG: DinB family protein [Dehalococcoidia bacterium]|nr:DinB family protein [Dehalococcoidia bacterium]
MDAPSLLRLAFNDLHTELMDDVAGLDDQDLFWQPAAGVNHIGFLLWHIVRDEDTVICQSVLRQPELWTRGSWANRFAMDAEAQGTGFESAELPTFRYPLADLLAYAWDVWAQTADAIGSLDPARLEEPLPWSKDWKLANLLTTGCLSHGWVHLGEIRQLRGLRGWRFRE